MIRKIVYTLMLVLKRSPR